MYYYVDILELENETLNKIKSGQYTCAESGECIPDSWVCDGYSDCEAHQDDEMECENNNGTDNSTHCNEGKGEWYVLLL